MRARKGLSVFLFFLFDADHVSRVGESGEKHFCPIYHFENEIWAEKKEGLLK